MGEGHDDKRKAFGEFPLPFELAELLTKSQQQMLDHPLRRELLRILQRDPDSLSATRIAATHVQARDLGLAVISYHLRKLADAGMIKPDGVRHVRGSQEHFFTSAVEGDVTVRRVLAETATSDAALFRERDGGDG